MSDGERRLDRSWPSRCVDVTCSADGRSHQVADVMMTAGLGREAGPLVALCGRTVVAAPMSAPPGAPCPLCAAVSELSDTPAAGAVRRI